MNPAIITGAKEIAKVVAPSLIRGTMGLFGSSNSNSDYIANAKALANFNAKLNYKYNQMYAENAPTWQRSGLESAGYNPMLAVQGYNAGSASSFSSTPSAGSYDYNSPATNALSLGKLVTDIGLAVSQSKQLEASAEKSKVETMAQLIKNKYLPDREKAEISQVLSDIMLNENIARTNTSNATTNRMNAETNKSNTLNAIAGTVLGALGLGGLGLSKLKFLKKPKVGF